MQKRLFLWLLCLTGILFVGCGDDNLGSPGTDGNNTNGNAQAGGITFNIEFAPQTKVSTASDFTSKWEEGDAIGIFAVAHGATLSANATGNHIHNVRLTYFESTLGDPSTGAWYPDGGASFWWPNDGTKLDFYAYYP